jgi:hypothetical protein
LPQILSNSLVKVIPMVAVGYVCEGGRAR